MNSLPGELVRALARFVPCEAAFFARSCRASWKLLEDDLDLWAEVARRACEHVDFAFAFLKEHSWRLAKKYPGLDRSVPVLAMMNDDLVKHFALSPNGNVLVGMTHSDLLVLNAKKWDDDDDDDIEEPKSVPVKGIQGKGSLSEIAFSPSGSLLACSGYSWESPRLDIIWIFDSKTWTLTHTVKGGENNWTSLCFLDDSTLVSASASGEILCKDVATGSLRFAINRAERLDNTFYAQPLAASRTKLAVAFENGTVKILSHAGKQLHHLRDHVVPSADGETNAVTCVAFTADESQLVSGGLDGTVREWDVLTGQCSFVHEFFRRESTYENNLVSVTSLALSSSRLLAVSLYDADEIRIVRLGSLDIIKIIQTSSPGWLAFASVPEHPERKVLCFVHFGENDNPPISRMVM